jgi:hypothetical protein
MSLDEKILSGIGIFTFGPDYSPSGLGDFSMQFGTRSLQTRIKKSGSIQNALKVLILISFLLLFYDLFRQNLSLFFDQQESAIISLRFFEISLLDSSSAIALLIGLVSIWVVREQFSIALSPHISYSSLDVSRVDGLPQSRSANPQFWKVELKNSGAGLAVILSVTYRIGFLGKPSPRKEFTMDFTRIVEVLTDEKLKMKKDFVLTRFGDGASIPPQGVTRVLAIRMDAMNKLEYLDILLTYRSVLGDTYQRVVHCKPVS